MQHTSYNMPVLHTLAPAFRWQQTWHTLASQHQTTLTAHLPQLIGLGGTVILITMQGTTYDSEGEWQPAACRQQLLLEIKQLQLLQLLLIEPMQLPEHDTCRVNVQSVQLAALQGGDSLHKNHIWCALVKGMQMLKVHKAAA